MLSHSDTTLHRLHSITVRCAVKTYQNVRFKELLKWELFSINDLQTDTVG